MKYRIRIAVIVVSFIFFSCGKQQEVKEQYCGLEMSGYEVMDYKAMGNGGYNYSEADKVIHAKLTEAINNLFSDSKNIQVSFAFKDNDKIALYIVAPDDKAVVETISCYLLETDIPELPKNKNLLFYTYEHDTLVAAVKSK